jgi:hypothetical protein
MLRVEEGELATPADRGRHPGYTDIAAGGAVPAAEFVARGNTAVSCLCPNLGERTRFSTSLEKRL